MNKVKKISRTTESHCGSIGRGDCFSVKQMLQEAGYSDKQIRKLRLEGRVLVTFKASGRFVKPGEELYVLDPEEDPPKPVPGLQ